MNKFLQLVTILVDDYDEAIGFYTNVLGFDLIEDSPQEGSNGLPKRWVVVRPPGGQTGLLLARADGAEQEAAVGNQTGGRVGFFLEVDDFDAFYSRLTAAEVEEVEIVRAPTTQPYGQVLVFRDISGNRWDLLGSPPAKRGPATDGEALK